MTDPKKRIVASRGRNSDLIRQRPIGEELRAAYQDIASEPMPERFKALLEQMRKAED